MNTFQRALVATIVTTCLLTSNALASSFQGSPAETAEPQKKKKRKKKKERYKWVKVFDGDAYNAAITQTQAQFDQGTAHFAYHTLRDVAELNRAANGNRLLAGIENTLKRFKDNPRITKEATKARNCLKSAGFKLPKVESGNTEYNTYFKQKALKGQCYTELVRAAIAVVEKEAGAEVASIAYAKVRKEAHSEQPLPKYDFDWTILAPNAADYVDPEKYTRMKKVPIRTKVRKKKTVAPTITETHLEKIGLPKEERAFISSITSKKHLTPEERKRLYEFYESTARDTFKNTKLSPGISDNFNKKKISTIPEGERVAQPDSSMDDLFEELEEEGALEDANTQSNAADAEK